MVKLKSANVGILFCISIILIQDVGVCLAQQSKQRRHSVSATNSSFLMNTPAEALLFATRFSAFRHHHYTQTPPSILNRRRYQPNFLYKPSAIIRAATTSMPLRGDQHPQIDDDVTIETIDDQRGNNSSRHTIMPVYFTHDRDTTVAQPQRPLKRVQVHPCEKSSCYPATGNLLIGREERLLASSTCGTKNKPDRFCIVSHLEEKKCFLCETNEYTVNDPLRNHRIGQIIYKNLPGTREQSWWQSQNGKENVTVQLDLEAEFHFTHLIIVFATFRPAAMLIERSYDFGKSWHVYRHFAHNCQESFPDVPRVSKNVTEVVCDQRYSSVEPSKNGEVIFRVLPPNMHIENPYADHIQNMLKMTNLRINFTKLHNLGDTLLDDREEIQEKYYYAISNMVVRGSCSCYGHASQCVPLDGVANKIDMVHGRCECTHNTKGLNCEECQDFYNDLPWKPALGKQTNACKACSCNDHADSCHFDAAVYEQSGRVSGGVCDNCKHNTHGQHCEECMPFFYRDPQEPITSPYVCQPCDCDPSGAIDDGICDSNTDEGSVAGACHCKLNAVGRRCDSCREGFWNLNATNADGCEPCTCNLLGTVGNLGCNQYSGECECKRLVTGKDCNQCMPETYGLSASPDGCEPCDCNAGGSVDNHCDVLTGQCQCRPNMQGKRCNEPKQHHFVPSLHNIYEAEVFPTECEVDSSYGNCTIVLREPPPEGIAPWTGPGYERVNEGNELVFTVDAVPKTMPYDVVIRYQTQSPGNWDIATISIVRPEPHDPNGPCADGGPQQEDHVPFSLPDHQLSVVALNSVCLEEGKEYKVKLLFERQRQAEENAAAQILVDSLTLVPRIEATTIMSGSPAADNLRQVFDHNQCNYTYYDVDYNERSSQECKDLLNAVSIFVYDGADPCNCNPTGSNTKKCEDFGGRCACKPNVVGRQCDRCAPGYYGFGPEGCKACDCNSIGSTDNNCDVNTGQCTCRQNTYGRQCDQCQPGFWNFPNCQICECNGHAQLCDQTTGECLSCGDSTTGSNCDRCLEGYYGNPLLGSEIGCRPCRCPDTVASNHTHSEACELDGRTNDMVCYCKDGYAGDRCQVCAENFFGHPELPGGKCESCNCSNNIDLRQTGNCDGQTGKCMQCLYDTDGEQCEYCRDGFHGDALQQQCEQCDCYPLGTNTTVAHCDRYTGQCPCLPNVIGIRCDECSENHWKIASGEGCEACDCDSIGSESEQCNRYTGQCQCKEGFGGRKCNECETNFWGDPNVECRPCDCDPYGSATQQCDRVSGQCNCTKGIGGYKCNECARGFLGDAPYCTTCGECFDNWDLILNGLKDETKRIIEQAKQIKTTGATGAYTKEFDAMQSQLDMIKSLLNNASISSQDIDRIEEMESEIRKLLEESMNEHKGAEETSENLYNRVNEANIQLDGLRAMNDEIKANANKLKENSTLLQESNVEGALNLARQAWQKANLLSDLNSEAQNISLNAERQCRRTEQLVNRSMDEFNALQEQNEQSLDLYLADYAELTSKIPDLNEQICDKRGDPCDSVCGGAGCSSCGGFSCENGALTRAANALKYVQEAEKLIKAKEERADELIRSLSQARSNATEAFKRAQQASQHATENLNNIHASINTGNELIGNLTEISRNNTGSPAEIEDLAQQTLKLNLQLDPESIAEFANQINAAVSQLENVESIIYETQGDLQRVTALKELALNTSERAQNVLNSAREMVKSLEDADEAQKKAKQAIAQANDDITSARNDLEEIDLQTIEAQSNANNTASNVDALLADLNEIKKDVTGNELRAKEIQDQSEIVRDAANKAHESAIRLRNNYSQASSSLTDKASTTESARGRAQQLLHRASVITLATKSKLEQLQSMSDTYKDNEKNLQDLQQRVDDLNDQMTNYGRIVDERSEYYRACSS